MNSLSLPLIIICTIASLSAADWPQWRGPHHNGTATATAGTFIESWDQQRLLWVSEAFVPGTYENDARKPKPRLTSPVPSGYSSPIVYQQKLYLAYYVPNGEIYPEELIAKHVAGGGRGRDHFSIEADDVVLCLDAQTGKTLWERRLVDSSFNLEAGFNKGGCQLTMAAGHGLVYALHPASRVRALAADTGDLVWDAPTGIRTLHESDRKEGLKELRMLEGGRNDFAGCIILAGDVVVVSDHQEFKGGPRTMAHGGNHLVAFDAKTGQRLWAAAGMGGRGMLGSTPLVWHSPEGPLLIASGEDGVACLRPKNGRRLWTIAEARFDNAAAIDGSRLVCGYNKGTACFDLSAETPTLRWQLAEALGFVSPVIMGDHLYAMLGKRRMSCVSMDDGSIRGGLPHEGISGSIVGGNERLAVQASGRGKAGLSFYRANPNNFNLLFRVDIPFANSTTPALADGILYIRGPQRLYAYNLRQ